MGSHKELRATGDRESSGLRSVSSAMPSPHQLVDCDKVQPEEFEEFPKQH